MNLSDGGDHDGLRISQSESILTDMTHVISPLCPDNTWSQARSPSSAKSLSPGQAIQPGANCNGSGGYSALAAKQVNNYHHVLLDLCTVPAKYQSIFQWYWGNILNKKYWSLKEMSVVNRAEEVLSLIPTFNKNILKSSRQPLLLDKTFNIKP